MGCFAVSLEIDFLLSLQTLLLLLTTRESFPLNNTVVRCLFSRALLAASLSAIDTSAAVIIPMVLK